MVVRAARHELARGRQRVGEGRARGAEIEAPRATRAELVLDEARRAREEHVGRDRTHDDDADVVGRQPRVRDRLARRLGAQIRRRDARIHDVPLADPRPLQDPLIGRVDHLLQIAVGEQPRRHIGRQRRNRRRAPAHARRVSNVIGRHHKRESLRWSAGAARPK